METEIAGESWSLENVDSWCKCHQHCRDADKCHYWNWYHMNSILEFGTCILYSKINETVEGAEDLYSGVKRCDDTSDPAATETATSAAAAATGEEISKVLPSVNQVAEECSSTNSTIWDKVR